MIRRKRNENDDFETYRYDWYLAAGVAAAHECSALVRLYGADFIPIGVDNETGENIEMTPDWLATNCRPRQG